VKFPEVCFNVKKILIQNVCDIVSMVYHFLFDKNQICYIYIYLYLYIYIYLYKYLYIYIYLNKYIYIYISEIALEELYYWKPI